MEQVLLKLKSGYSIAAIEEDGKCVIYVADEEGVYSQEILTITPSDDGTDFTVKIFGDENTESESEADNSIESGTTIDGEMDDEEVAERATTIAYYGDHSDLVKKIQQRLKDLGYFNGTIGGNFLAKTKAAVEAFQEDAGLHIDGSSCDNATMLALFDASAPRAKIAVPPESGYPKEMDWWTSDIRTIFAKGATALITDVETGLQWKEQRRGGTNHADVQPLTKNDTANLKKAYGGKWAWTRRAIIVTIDGKHYAASMNGMPHGGGSISGNGFDGHHCIHFTNSRTHCSNKVDANHQKMVKKAASTKLPESLCPTMR